MVSVFPGRFATEPQKAPALTPSQTVKAVAGRSRGRRREQGRVESSRGGGRESVEESRGGGIESQAEDNNGQ